jgi:hypothetical protein
MRRKGCYEQPFLVSGITSCSLVLPAFPVKRHADDLAVRIALRTHQQAATVARGSAAMSVSHKFLLHADGRPDSVKPSAIGVTERMRSHAGVASRATSMMDGSGSTTAMPPSAA